MRPQEREELLAAYALDALSGPEADEVEALVAGDPEAAEQLAAYREIADLIGLEAPLRRTDPALRERMLQSAQRMRPTPTRRFPALRVAAVAAALAVLAIGVSWGVGLQRSIDTLQQESASLAAIVAADTQRIDVIETERVGSGGDEAVRTDVQGEIDTHRRIIAILADPNVQEASLESTEAGRGASGRYLWSAELGAGVVIAQQLPPLPIGTVYELWLIEGFDEVSGGTFVPTPDGDAQVLIELDFEFNPFSVAITPAPVGGAEVMPQPIVLSGWVP
ncbi:MAG: anti-sigma factor [Chloroflexi bacterium]|nr:anti-sigma factor [Chloroflexota bacterium]MXZ45396.1 anti-sigma factor [Chloroflexota bacterium]